MKLLLLTIIPAIFSVGCGGFSSKAQIRESANGSVVNRKIIQTDNKTTPKTLDLSLVDFKNFTFPDFGNGNAAKTFTLKGGTSDKRAVFPKFNWRKTYLFELTGDDENEAVTHVIAEGCQMGCESSHLFYIYTADGKQPKLLWKFAVAGDVLGGLKAVNFKIDEIVLEAFGECSAENGLIKPNVDLEKNPKLKTSNYTRFVFTRDANGFAQTGKDILPLANTNLAEYRPQISFGEPE